MIHGDLDVFGGDLGVKSPDLMVTIMSLTSLLEALSLAPHPDRSHAVERYPMCITLSSCHFLRPQVGDRQ